jgi:hypothetical protein
MEAGEVHRVEAPGNDCSTTGDTLFILMNERSNEAAPADSGT